MSDKTVYVVVEQRGSEYTRLRRAFTTEREALEYMNDGNTMGTFNVTPVPLHEAWDGF